MERGGNRGEAFQSVLVYTHTRRHTRTRQFLSILFQYVISLKSRARKLLYLTFLMKRGKKRTRSSTESVPSKQSYMYIYISCTAIKLKSINCRGNHLVSSVVNPKVLTSLTGITTKTKISYIQIYIKLHLIELFLIVHTTL